MSIAIPTASYSFPSGGCGLRKQAKQRLIPQGNNAILYLPGGNAAQPISPSFGSWNDTSQASRLKGYIAYDLAHKLGQGGNTTSCDIFDASPASGSHDKTCLVAQHVALIPNLFTPSSGRGAAAGYRGAFELKNRMIDLVGSNSYRGVVGIDVNYLDCTFDHVSGAFDPDPNDIQGDRLINATWRPKFTIRLVDHNGSTVGSTSTYLGGTATVLTGGLVGQQLSPTFVTESYTSPNDRLPCYLVTEFGLSVHYSGSNFVYQGGGTWKMTYIDVEWDTQFSDTDDNLMQPSDTNIFSTYVAPFDLSSGRTFDTYFQSLAASR